MAAAIFDGANLTLQGDAVDDQIVVSTEATDVLRIELGNGQTFDLGAGTDSDPNFTLQDNEATLLINVGSDGVDVTGLNIDVAGGNNSVDLQAVTAGIENIEVIGGADDDVLSAANLTQSVTLIGGGGNDTLTGGSGDDILAGGGGTDIIDGGAGNDTNSFEGIGFGVVATVAADGTGTAQYGTVNETFTGIENLTGSDNDDVLTAVGDADNILSGGLGFDVLAGGGGNDILDGGAGDDSITGGDGDDQLFGGDGSDEIVGGAGNDLLLGQLGDDELIGGEGNDELLGGDGNDELKGDEGEDLLQGGLGNDQLEGGSDDDLLISDAIDVINGGTGIDTVDFADATSGVIIDLDVNSAGPVGTPGQDGGILNAPPGSVAVAGVVPFENILFEVDDVENVIGSQFNDGIFGNNEVNVLEGGLGNDAIHGFGSDDFLVGGEGIDTVLFSASPTGVEVDLNDQVSEAELDAILLGLSTPVFAATGGAGNNVLSSFENITGSQSDDILIGDDNDNVINGNGGSDQLVGNLGDDTFVSDALDTVDGGLGNDTIDFSPAAAGVIIDLDVNSAGPAGTSSQDGGILNAPPGSVAVAGVVPEANILFEVDDIENVIGSSFNDGLFGNNEVNILQAGAGNDVIHGFAGDDFQNGGSGIDTVLFAASPSGVVANLNAQVSAADFADAAQNGADAAFAATGGAGSNVLSQFENITGSQNDDILIGDSADNVINGNGGSDQIVGGAGDDLILSDAIDDIDAGTGNDTVDFSAAAAGIIVDLDVNSAGAAGTPSQDGGILNAPPGSVAVVGVVPDANILFEVDDVENVIGTPFNDGLFGNNEVNVLQAGAGDDVIHGFAGDDFQNGGEGNDTVLFAAAPAEVIVDLNDQVSIADFDSAVAAPSTAPIAATGGAGSNVLAGFENITGSQNDDVLIGDDNTNVINGNGGSDDIVGGDGDDVFLSDGTDNIDGGLGIDTVDFTPAPAGIIVDLDVNSAGAAGTPSQDGGILNAPPGSVAVAGVVPDANILFEVDDIENVVGSQFNDGLFGNNEVNVLEGAAGDDVIHGFAGDDFQSGGDGNDTVLFAAAPASVNVDLGDQVSGISFDAIVAGEAPATIAATGGAGNNVLSQFENITGSQNDDVLVGDSNDNVINGNGGDDSIAGNAGNDTLIGGLGNDTLLGGTDNDILQGGDGDDTLNGNSGNDEIFGDEGNDVLAGSTGDDELLGGAGDDEIDGGTGNDDLTGGLGIDTLIGGLGADILDGIPDLDPLNILIVDDAESIEIPASEFPSVVPFSTNVDTTLTVTLTGQDDVDEFQLLNSDFSEFTLSDDLTLTIDLDAGESFLLFFDASADVQQASVVAGPDEDSLSFGVAAFNNPVNSADVNQTGSVTPLDALEVINALSVASEPGVAPGFAISPTADSLPLLDVNADGNVTPLDALQVINALVSQDPQAAAAPETQPVAEPQPEVGEEVVTALQLLNSPVTAVDPVEVDAPVVALSSSLASPLSSSFTAAPEVDFDAGSAEQQESDDQPENSAQGLLASSNLDRSAVDELFTDFSGLGNLF